MADLTRRVEHIAGDEQRIDILAVDRLQHADAPGSSERDPSAATRRPSINSRSVASMSVTACRRSTIQSSSVSGSVVKTPSAVTSVTIASQTASAEGSIM